MNNKKVYLSFWYFLPFLMIAVAVICYEPAKLLALRWGNSGTWRLVIIPVALLMWIDSLSRYKTFTYSVALGPFCTQLFATALLTLVSYFSSSSLISELAITSVVISIIWIIGGNGIVVRSLWPIGYFIGMVTISARIIPASAPFFQYISALATEHLLNLFGFATIRNDLLLRLPATTLRVGYWCSGANQLISLLALAIPLAFFRHRSWWKQAVLITSALPVALFFNILRILLIALWNYSVHRNAIHGPGEILLIPIIHPFAIAVLVGLSLMLDRTTTLAFLSRDSVKQAFTLFKEFMIGSKSGIQWYFFTTVYCVLLLIILIMRSDPKTEFSLPIFQERIGEFTKTEAPRLPVMLGKEMYDTLITTSYFNGYDTATVMIYGLKKQHPARSLLLNVFEKEEDWENKTNLHIDETPPLSTVGIRLTDSNDESRYSALYWYIINGKSVVQPSSVFFANLSWWFEKNSSPNLLIAVVTPNKIENTAGVLNLAAIVNSQILQGLK